METFGLFVVSIAAYLISFYFPPPYDPVAEAIKGLPLATLSIFVQVEHRCNTSYARRLAVGLLFSAVGDFCINWIHLSDPEGFILGLLAFAVAQLLYALAFDVTRITFDSLIVVPMATAVLTYAYLLPGLKGALTALVAMYIILLFFMTAAATSRLRRSVTWPRALACAGAWLFDVSDFVLAADKFRAPISHNTFVRLPMYFLAQCFIALSVLESKDVPNGMAKSKGKRKGM